MPKENYLPCLLQLFRQYGYDGATLSKIAEATGLGKASLYHHFPKGKAEMAREALNQVNQWLETRLLRILNGPETAIAKFESMCQETGQFFNQGQNSCLWAVFLMEQSSDDLFHDQISVAFSLWIDAISKVLITAGLDQTLAKERGEDAMIAIQGALILSHGLKDFTLFQRTLKQLPQQLCEGIENFKIRLITT